jgi:Fe-S cluster assembly ATP-binding protein
MLTISNLTARVNDKEILSDISFQVAPGQCLLITGHNGSGKSTLLHTIMGRPDIIASGYIDYQGLALQFLECHDRARQGVFMFHQTPPTIDGVNTMTLLNEINNLQTNKFSKRQLIDQAKQMFSELNLPEDWTKRQFNNGASGGERKKNELVQAELFAGGLLLLDEPDSGLEQSSRQRIIDLIAKNSERGGITLLVTHDRDLQNAYMKNHIELENGRIVKH